ncbi:DUF6381 family protein [Streptomyces sp. NBC_01218]|uniref:DUF6381 family protein n=1 Tax=unclassified Streptomyces TaxID=2593676 RepID=UPI0023B88A7C|nr:MULTISPECIES: DUF6381 family protein [unclassified Streptomyces]WEH43921.1 DUF6381 family protein [Streptomyces sp. AM 2-1-1]WSQ55578.1 DUF6381 family protein [Streptomyces sp. NBC_01218]
MSGADEPAKLAQQMRDKARQLSEAAESAKDPEERQRLTAKASKMRARSEQQSGMSSGDIYPQL